MGNSPLYSLVPCDGDPLEGGGPSRRRRPGPVVHGRRLECRLRPSPHTASVTCVVPIRPGMIVTGSADTTMLMSNYETGERVKLWTGHTREVVKLAYRNKAGAHHLISASRDATVRVWDFTSPGPIHSFEEHSLAVTGLALVSDTVFASGSRDSAVKLYDLGQAKSIASASIPRNLVTHLAYSQAAQLLAQTSEDKELKLWDTRTLEVAQRMPQTSQILTHCDWSGDGRLVSAASNGFNQAGADVLVYETRQPSKPLLRLSGHEETVTAAVFLSQQITWKPLLLSVSLDKTARLWSLEDGARLWTETVSSGGGLLSAVGFNDGSIVATGHNAAIAHLRLEGRAGRPCLLPHSLALHAPQAKASEPT